MLMPCATAPAPQQFEPKLGMEVGPLDWFEAATAHLHCLNHMLRTGHSLRLGIPPHQLTAAELIDFWADH